METNFTTTAPEDEVAAGRHWIIELVWLCWVRVRMRAIERERERQVEMWCTVLGPTLPVSLVYCT